MTKRQLPLPENPTELRGIFGKHGDSPQWLEATKDFPNGVPRFESREKCVEFMHDYLRNHGGSNPDYPHLGHIFTTLVSWEQVERILLPAIRQAREEPSYAPKIPLSYGETPDDDSPNVYERSEARPVVDEINERLDVPFHRCVTPESVMNTLKYLFFHMKCGIYVMIRDGKLRVFCPFVNKDYRNTWSKRLRIEGQKPGQEAADVLSDYYLKKMNSYRPEEVDADISKWWANGNIICNETGREDDPKTLFWGDHFLAPLRDMLGEACRERVMPDCEFFINKRDYPHLKVNVQRGVPVEPYGFVFDKDDRDPNQDIDLVEERRYKSFAPIVSFYAAAPDRFTDVPWPSSEDWEGACGLVFPHRFTEHSLLDSGVVEIKGKPRDLFTEANFRKFERAWEDNRVATAFFRGTATGGGTTADTNQRLKLAEYCNKWKDDPEKGGDEPLLDAQIVGWNLRDKKIASGPMTFLRRSDFNFTAGTQHFTPIYEQSKYKYLVYADGHCAACRYGFMMRLGSVIIKVLPRQVADRMWYFPILKEYEDHVPVKADLSDLEEKLKWCRDNDDKCKEIGKNALAFYEKYVARNALLDYVQMACRHMAKRQKDPPDWWKPPPPELSPPSLSKPDGKCFEDHSTKQARYCTRCQEEVNREELEKAQTEEDARQSQDAAESTKKRLADRRKRKAEEKRLAEEAKKAKTDEHKK